MNLRNATTNKPDRKGVFIRVRVTPERRRQIRVLLASREQTMQSFFERGLELALAQVQKEKN